MKRHELTLGQTDRQQTTGVLQSIIELEAQKSKHMLHVSRLNILRIQISLVSSYNGHDKNIKKIIR